MSEADAAELAEMKARHLAQTREAQDIALRLMRAAGLRADRALAQAQTAPEPEPEPEPGEPRPRRPDHCLEVARLERALHHAMAYEARLLNGHFARPARTTRYTVPNPAPGAQDTAKPGAPPDPRRALVRQPFQHALKARRAPEQAARLAEIDHSIDEILTADPNQILRPGDIVDRLAQRHDIELDPKSYTDELLGLRRPTPADDHLPIQKRHRLVL